MAIHKIIRMGAPGLRQKAEAIPENELQSKSLKKLIRDMRETMQENDGAGLAAVQIGILRRIILVAETPNPARYPEAANMEPEQKVQARPQEPELQKQADLHTEKSDEDGDGDGDESVPQSNGQKMQVRIQAMINPEIMQASAEKQEFWEGCLSIPGMRGLVERPKQVRVKYIDSSGEAVEKDFSGFQAIVVQHEIDHLNGILYVDRLKSSTLFGFCEELDATQAI